MTRNTRDRRATMRPTRRTLAANWVVMPILILLFAAVYLALFSPLISWMLGGGIQGTFVARDLDCHKGCAWFGDFTSANRTVVLQDVRLAQVNEPPSIKIGAAIPVVDISSALNHGVVYPRHVTARDILSPSVLVALLLGLLPVTLLLLWLRAVPLRYVVSRRTYSGE
jgi:hypothetical protein